MKKNKEENMLEEIPGTTAIPFARVECCSCKEAFFVRMYEPGSFLIPHFIEEGEVFSGDCPICEASGFVRFITYIVAKQTTGA